MPSGIRGVWGYRLSGRRAAPLPIGFVVGLIARAWLLVGLILGAAFLR